MDVQVSVNFMRAALIFITRTCHTGYVTIWFITPNAG